ncbi:MAG: ubiquinol-cytochrome c reductase iron-sulfur subunit [Xanthomonadales bacterium]|nr:ubiquinol-cytochrome c reductase iron-sulfur subunit [Xanthomonadales bacterium]
MSNDELDRGRRRFLTNTTAVVGGVGVIAAAIPFIKTWQPSARARAAGAPVTADISKIELGQMVKYPWRSVPVFVVHRTKAQLATLTTGDVEDRLKDAHSEQVDQQPEYAKNEHRSIKPEWLVMVGICTHLGCVPDFKPKIGPEPFDPDWQSGFFCPCHKSRYDISGRVYNGSPAPLNMVIPPYHYIDDTHVQIGVDPKGAA